MMIRQLNIHRINQQQGFSLIELMIVVAIIGVLGFVAYPSYQNFLKTTHRTDAMAHLIELTAEMEQYKYENLSYLGAAASGSDIGVPDANRVMALEDDVTRYYTITISAATRDSYMLQAVPIDSQSDDVCGTIRVGMNGTFSYQPSGGGAAPKECKE